MMFMPTRGLLSYTRHYNLTDVDQHEAAQADLEWLALSKIGSKLIPVFNSKYHDTRYNASFIFDVANKKKISPTLLEYAKEKNRILDTWEISAGWAWGNFLVFSKGHLPHLPCKRVNRRPQLPLHEVNRVNNEKFNRLLFIWSLSTSSYCVQLTKILTSNATFSIRN